MYIPFNTFYELNPKLRAHILDHLTTQHEVRPKFHLIKSQIHFNDSKKDPLNIGLLLDEFLRRRSGKKFHFLNLTTSPKGYWLNGSYHFEGRRVFLDTTLMYGSTPIVSLPQIEGKNNRKNILNLINSLAQHTLNTIFKN